MSKYTKGLSYLSYSKEVVDKLVDLSNHGDSIVREAAVNSMSKFIDDKEIRRRLRIMKKDPDKNIQRLVKKIVK